MNISNEAKFGILAVITIALIIFGLNYMSGSSLFGPPLVLYAKYDNVDGLLPGNPILINGFRVGKVGKMDLNMQEGLATASLEFERFLEIPNNSLAEIHAVDLLGSKGIRIILPDSLLPASEEFFESGDRIEGTNESSVFDVSKDLVETKGTQILIEVGKLSVKLNELVQFTQQLLLDENNSNSLRASLKNIQETTENLTSISAEVDSLAVEISTIAVDASSIVKNVEGSNDEITDIINNVRNTTDSLVEASVEVKHLMADASSAVGKVENMVAKLDTTGGTLGLLLNDRTLYDSINATTENVNTLLRELKANPTRFFDDIKIYLVERKD